MTLETLFCERLDEDESALLCAQQREHRIHIIRNLLPTNRRDVPADRRALIDTYFLALSALLGGAPAAAAAHMTHWAPSLYLLHVADERTSPAAAEQAASNLFAMLLFERLADGTSPLKGLRFVTCTDGAGAIHVFSQDARIRLEGLSAPRARLQWECDEQSAKVLLPDGMGRRIDLPLPEGGGSIERIPFDRAPRWDIPIVEDCWASILRGDDAPRYNTTRSASRDVREPLPLRDSLAEVHRIFATLWPEVIPWMKRFIPAVVEVPSPPDSKVRVSGSRLPGTPVHLCRVADPFGHAEDLVHELQHARMQFLSPLTSYFGGFRHPRPTFMSPYRTDPRPLTGLHLGLHAFLAVSALRLRALHAGRAGDVALADLLRVHRMNLFSYRTIMAHEQISTEGRQLYREIARTLWEQHQEIEPLAAPVEGAGVEAWLEGHRARVLGSRAIIENQRISFEAMTAEEAFAAVQIGEAPRTEVQP